MSTEKALVHLTQAVDVSEAVEQAMLVGDLAKLKPELRVQYYNAVCLSLGLNPLTRPFDFIKDDSGKLQMYARKECAEQLRKLHKVSVLEAGREWIDEHTLCIMVRASTPDGRQEDEMGIVYLAGKDGKPFTGQLRANQMMKCLTKAKRRATLAICGLGFELADDAPTAAQVHFDPVTGAFDDEDVSTDPRPALPEATTPERFEQLKDELYGEETNPTAHDPATDEEYDPETGEIVPPDVGVQAEMGLGDPQIPEAVRRQM